MHAIFFILGAVTGSFLNMLAYRIPEKLKITGRSFCPECKKTIPWYYNIPVLSYLILKGRCAFCGKRISLRYFIVEFATTSTFLLSSIKFEFNESIFAAIFSSSLILAAAIDFERKVVYDLNNLFTLITGMVYMLLFKKNLLEVVLAAVLSLSILYISKLIVEKKINKEALGSGDFYFVLSASIFLGIKVIYGLFIASFTGALAGYFLLYKGRIEKYEAIPFIPYLTGGFLISLFFL